MALLPFAFFALLAAPSNGDETDESRVTFYANGRVRAESTFDQTNGEDRHRGRMRFRAGAKYTIIESLVGEVRLSTASDGRDANNPHWDFGDGADNFQGLDVVLDRFLLKYSPCNSLTAYAGKFPHVFAAPPVYSEFVWDMDVHPAGAAVVWNPESNDDGPRFDVRLAQYVVAERGADTDPSMFGAQANVAFDVASDTELRFGTGIQSWNNLGTGAIGNQGNTTSGGNWDNEFLVWDTFLAAKNEGGPMGRQQGFVQFVNNLDDDSGEDAGLALGFELGKREPGDVSFFAAWYDFDANALFSPVAQDDTPISGTGSGQGMSGILAGLRRTVSDQLSIRLWVLTSDADASDDPWRVRLDLDFKIR